MNNLRRKSLQNINDQIEVLKDELEGLMSEEEEYRDNLPENMQGGEKYEKADEACNNLYYAISSLGDAVCSIEAAIE